MSANGRVLCACGAREPAVEFRHVTFRYCGATRDAVSDVSLRVDPGTVVVITGESGCGKTTLMRMVNALIPLAYQGDGAGEVLVAGRAVGDWTTSELARTVGSVFQNPRSQFVNADVASEIAFGCENLGVPYKEMQRRVAAAAARFKISHLLEREVAGLSGGQRQMVMLACAAAVDPDVYVLDEPTSSLDVPAMRALGRAVRSLKAAGKTVLVFEHRLWWLADVADRIAVMRNGTLLGDYTTEAFARIPAVTRRAWGLRALSVAEMEAGPVWWEAAARPDGHKDAADDGADGSTDAAIGSADGAVAEDRLRRAAPSCGAVPAVCAEDLVVGYRHMQRVLDGLDMALEPGRIVALAGSNGAGKTTLARCLAGLMKQRSGSVLVGGRRLSWRRRCGQVYLVMQEPAYQLFSSSVEEELRLSLEGAHVADGVVDRRVANMVASMGLEGLESAHPLELSGGQRQRLSIGAGVLHGACAIVLDEPTSGLDGTSMMRIASCLRALAHQGTGICVITHDFEFLCAVCDEVLCLQNGRIGERLAVGRENMARLEALFGFG